jgi:hypothetical protein
MQDVSTPTAQRASRGTTPPHRTAPTGPGAALEGMWVVLVPNEGQLPIADADGRVPVMARSGDVDAYLLVWKNVAKARQFVTAAELEGAEPRLVVRSNRDELLNIARSAKAVGVLVDYDAQSQQYGAATPLA